MLSFNNTGKRIAKIVGGDHNEKVISLDVIDNNFLKKYVNDKDLSDDDIEKLRLALVNKIEPSNKILKELYNKCITYLNSFQDIEVDDALIQLMPTNEPDQVDMIYISGPMGSGKSHFVSSFANEYHKLHPKNTVILFCRSSEDKTLDKFKWIKRMPIDENLLDDPIDPESELRNTLCIFDDIDTINDKELREYVQMLRDDLIQTGRKFGITTIATSQQTTNYKLTRELLNQCTALVFFPKSGSVNGIKRALTCYCGLDKNQIDKIMKLPTRAVAVLRRYPMCVVYQSGIYLL